MQFAMPEKANKRVLIIAGPNGAGKSTFAKQFLPNEASCPIFVNADLIAAGLSPFAPEAAAMEAGKLMLNQIRRHVSAGTSFSFETTLAGRSYAQMIPDWQSAGFIVHLIFLRLRTVELAIERVAARVSQGGHAVEESVIRRRFDRGWSNFQGVYCDLVDSWEVYDNSGTRNQLISRSRRE